MQAPCEATWVANWLNENPIRLTVAAGRVAKSAGAPVEKYITLTIDTSEFDEDQECLAYIRDSSETHNWTSCGVLSAQKKMRPGSCMHSIVILDQLLISVQAQGIKQT